MYLKKELSEAQLPIFCSKQSGTIKFSRFFLEFQDLLHNGFYLINFG